MGRNLAVLVGLFVLAVSPWLGLLDGELVHDDLHVVAAASDLRLKPSKPVANLLLRLGGREAFLQRGLSVALHGLAAVALYLLLRALALRGAFLAAVLFAWFPVHGETLGVALFRMDLLGTLFSWVAALFFLRGRLGGYVAAAALAAFSKEVYVLLAPALALGLRAAAGTLDRRGALALGGVTLALGGAVALALARDAAGDFPYRGVVGPGVLGGSHLDLAWRAWGEGWHRIFLGRPLSTISLLDRTRAGEGTPVAAGLLVAVALLWFLVRGERRERAWAAAALLGVALYLAIPNVNLGAERYWYFPAGAAAVLVASLASRLETRLPRFRAAVGLGLYGLALLVPLTGRVTEFRSRLGFYTAEWERHPEVATAWSNVAAAWLERRGLDRARPLLEEASRLDADHPRVRIAWLQYHFLSGDREGFGREARWLLPRLPGRLREGVVAQWRHLMENSP